MEVKPNFHKMILQIHDTPVKAFFHQGVFFVNHVRVLPGGLCRMPESAQGLNKAVLRKLPPTPRMQPPVIQSVYRMRRAFPGHDLAGVFSGENASPLPILWSGSA